MQRTAFYSGLTIQHDTVVWLFWSRLSSSSLPHQCQSRNIHFYKAKSFAKVTLISSIRRQNFSFDRRTKNNQINRVAKTLQPATFSTCIQTSAVVALKTSQLCFNTEEAECCQRELKMAAESQNPGAEPSSADGGQACGWMAGFEGSSLLGWKWISERHNGSLRRVCGVVLKPCLRCLDSFMPSGACSGQLSHTRLF